jgi:cation diffusion facilitator CzcD-associated flavoprotein CzcO
VSYASSSEIKGYLQAVAGRFGIDQYIRFNTKVVLARWSDTTNTWTVNNSDGSSFESELLFNAGGILNNPQYPAIKGFSDFSGPVLHTAAWNNSVQLTGKRVGIIGAGASAVQLLPQIQPIAEKIYMFIRTPSWISPAVAMSDATRPDQLYRADEKRQFRDDELQYLTERKSLESQFNRMFPAFMKLSPQQQDLRNRFEARMKELIADERLQKKLIPNFEAGCRRINPGEQYLVSLQEPNVEPVFDGINCITPNSVQVGGKDHEIDILVAATGFNTTFKPRFPIFGRGETNLQDLWMSDPVSYLGTGVSGFPNYFTFLGPNTPISNGSLMGEYAMVKYKS